MSYLTLYRRFRPQKFDQIIGQEHIVGILSNAVENGKLGHAYLFSGSRGTGKTTTARILAKAANCLNPQNGSPCTCCTCCKLAQEGSLDILEIDAASNNKVDEIRDLREKIKYPPVSLKYKVYIIDEVHMLSDAAFNALLKTLEEPPEHAMFILATTEAHKLPATILSRCLKFEFRLVQVQQLEQFLATIFDKIGKEYEKEALSILARNAEGSVRDALSLADVCANLSQGKLTAEQVLNAVGAGGQQEISDLAQSIAAKDLKQTLKRLDALLGLGKSAGLIARDLTLCFRNIMMLKTLDNAQNLVCLPLSDIEKLRAVDVLPTRCIKIIEILALAEGALRLSSNPRILLESACAKAAVQNEDDEQIQQRLEKLEAEVIRLKK